MSAIAANYERIRASLPSSVKLVAVSKTRSVADIRVLYDLGHRVFGENYPQELKEKQAQLPSDIEWHFIGHLQRSNVKHIIAFTHLVHGADSEKLLDELNKRAEATNRTVNVLLQAHIAQEETKHGFSLEELHRLLGAPGFAERWPHARIRGLMGMASNTDDRGQVTQEFASLAEVFRATQKTGMFPVEQFTELSMGMSGDADLAIAQGSTLVRIGSAIFGERTT
jgi:PLP dependent protein